MQGFYSAIKSIYGPRRSTLTPVASSDGTIIHKEREDILNRWSEHFRTLLNHRNIIDGTVIEALPTLPPIPALDRTPEFHEELSAIKSIREGKSCGPDGIPGELFKHGGYLLKKQLHEDICALWNG